jgi:DNA-binding HxlR family transcriptional regulator
LDQSGLIHRRVYPAVPLMVEYSLTPLGEMLVKPLKTLCDWVENVDVRKRRESIGLSS